jgi:hypothetical protein
MPHTVASGAKIKPGEPSEGLHREARGARLPATCRTPRCRKRIPLRFGAQETANSNNWRARMGSAVIKKSAEHCFGLVVLSSPVHDFPFETSANPFEQSPIVKPQHRLT